MRTTLPKKAIALIAAVTVAGAAALAARVTDVARWSAADLGAALALLAVTTVGERFSMKFRFGDQTKNVTATDAGFAAALILGVRPSALILGVAAGVVGAHTLRRTAAHKTAFNVGSFVLALSAAVTIHRAAMPAGPVLATIPAMAAFFAVNAGTIVGVIALVEGRSFVSVFRPIARIESLSAAGTTAVGVTMSTVWWAPAVAIAAILLLAASGRGRARGRATLVAHPAAAPASARAA